MPLRMNSGGLMKSLGALLLVTSQGWAPVSASKPSLAKSLQGDAAEGPPHHKASLLRKKWDWKTASGESVTEWAIVLRRFHMVDMELTDLLTMFSFDLPVNPETGMPQTVDMQADLPRMRKKVEKLSENLENAVKDQQTADDTFGNMETDRRLSASDKEALAVDHRAELRRSQELLDLGRASLSHAKSLLSCIDVPAGAVPGPNCVAPAAMGSQAAPASPKAGMRAVSTANATLPNATSLNATAAAAAAVAAKAAAEVALARAKAAPELNLFAAFRANAASFSAKVQEFDHERAAASVQPKLVMVRRKLAKAIVVRKV